MNKSQNEIMALFGENESITHKKAKELLPNLTKGQIAGAIYKLKQDGKLRMKEKGVYLRNDENE